MTRGLTHGERSASEVAAPGPTSGRRAARAALARMGVAEFLLVCGLAARSAAGPALVVQNRDRLDVEVDVAAAPLVLVAHCPAGTTLRARVRGRDGAVPLNVALWTPDAEFPALAGTGPSARLRVETDKQGAYRLELRPTAGGDPVRAVVTLRWASPRRERHRVAISPHYDRSEWFSFYGAAGERIEARIRAKRRSNVVPRLGRLTSANRDTDLDLEDADTVAFEPLVSQQYTFELDGGTGADGVAVLDVRRHRTRRRIVLEPAVADGAEGSAILAVARPDGPSVVRFPPGVPLAGGELRVPESGIPRGTTAVAALGDAFVVTDSALDALSLPMLVTTRPTVTGTLAAPIEVRLPVSRLLTPWSGGPGGWWPSPRVLLHTLEGEVTELPSSAWSVEESGKAVVVKTSVLGTVQAFYEATATTRLSADSSGTTLIVGHPGAAVDGVFGAGEVLVYEWDGSAWQPSTVVGVPEPVRLGRFGDSVCIDGDLMVVSEPGRIVSGSRGVLIAHVYRRSGDRGWASDGEIFDEFGERKYVGTGPLALALAGDNVLVGSAFPRGGSEGPLPLSVLVYERLASGWALTQRLVDANSPPAALFGVALAAADDRVLVGVSQPTSAPTVEVAQVYRREVGGWALEARLSTSAKIATCAPPGAYPSYVRSVAISGDRACVGRGVDSFAAPAGEGEVVLFERSAVGWSETTKIRDPQSEVECRADYFGHACAISPDLLVVGAPSWASQVAERGTAAVYRLDSTGVTLVSELAPDPVSTQVFFGDQVVVTDVPESRIVVLPLFPKPVVSGNVLDSVYMFAVE